MTSHSFPPSAWTRLATLRDRAIPEDLRATLGEALASTGGEVVIRCAAGVSRIHLHKGRIAWVTSPTLPVRLTDRLLRDGRVAREVLLDVLKECQEQRLNFAETLVTWGLLERDYLRTVLIEHNAEHLRAVFLLPSPRMAMFVPQARSYQSDFLFDLEDLIPADPDPTVDLVELDVVDIVDSDDGDVTNDTVIVSDANVVDADIGDVNVSAVDASDADIGDANVNASGSRSIAEGWLSPLRESIGHCIALVVVEPGAILGASLEAGREASLTALVDRLGYRWSDSPMSRLTTAMGGVSVASRESPLRQVIAAHDDGVVTITRCGDGGRAVIAVFDADLNIGMAISRAKVAVMGCHAGLPT